MSLAALCAQAVDAQIRYYDAVGRLTARAARAVSQESVHVSRPPQRHAPPKTAPVPSPTAILLESEGGSCAVGMFVVENHLSEPVSGSIAPSTFVDADGREVRPRLAFAPDVVRLQPGEQALIRVAAAFDDRLRPGVHYLGTIAVPGVSSASVAVVLRRLEPAAAALPPAP